MTQHTSPDLTARYPVWDRAVRSFHWYLPISIGVMWWSGGQGRMDIHEKVGYRLLCLVATCIIWGFIGSEAVRFRAFLFAPRTVLNYLRAGGQYAGQNLWVVCRFRCCCCYYWRKRGLGSAVGMICCSRVHSLTGPAACRALSPSGTKPTGYYCKDS